MRHAKTKKHYYLSVAAAIALIVHMIGGIFEGRQSLPGSDLYLAENPDRFWIETVLFLFLGFGVLIHSCYKIYKTNKE
tara:strand:+ start:12105 stop:12338 length:234 start_codon:yes stop_codon:yes gene_type:complete